MDGAILPHWFWFIYYLFLLVVFLVGVNNVFKKRIYILSVIVVILTIIVPITSIVNSLFLDFGTNELTHLISELQAGAKWSVFAILGYIYMVIYISIFFIKKCISMYQNH